MRRKYEQGRCQDCGKFGRVTWVTFWVNGFRMRLCAPCVAGYKAVILKEGKA